MKYKKIFFSILESIENKKIEQQTSHIQNLYNQKKNILNN